MKKKKTWEQQIRADQQNWYDETHTTQVKLKLNYKTDADILEWLEASGNKQGAIKEVIRKEMARS